jgi:glycosyltransferase involved in cell wall biosynthesis
MMSAKPIIHAIDAGNDLVSESGCGISILPEDAGALAEAVQQLRCMTETDRHALGLNGRQYALAHHDYRVLAQQFLSILTDGQSI